MNYLKKILTVDELVRTREGLREQDVTLVQCHGCFDIVHPGHIRYLRYAKTQGARLLVSLTADEHVGKGFDRPLIPEHLRAENLAALEFVDYVVISDHPTALELLERVRPDVYIKGKEYENSADTRFSGERALVERYGGTVVFSSGDVVFSSSHLVNFVRGEYALQQDKVAFYLSRHGIDVVQTLGAIRSLSSSRFVVLGDPIVDRYTHCEGFTIASEHPIPSVSPVESVDYAGGAALIAAQLAHLGADVSLVAPVHPGDPLCSLYHDLVSALSVELVPFDHDERPIFMKTRYLVDDKKVFKVNVGHRTSLSTRAIRQALDVLESRLEGADGLILTDFGYGLFGAEFIDGIHELCARLGVPCVVDVSGAGTSNLLRFKGVALAAPTEDELRRTFGDYDSGISNLCSRYYEATQAQLAVVTMGKRGALLMSRPKHDGSPLVADYLPALSSHPFDVVGAGDVFLSGFAGTLLSGSSPALSLLVGSLLAGCHIHEVGNAPTSLSSFHHQVELFFERMAPLATHPSEQ